ncbi:neuropeptide CCHamide-2 [Lucilia sericata]|nr:neuropeptide CCHamide-2 [Lucilia sericata]XP_037817947.1 neuropeptide CCHamide-2 [Lucilia sericata]KAI8129963.1 Neuropeptide CCHamide-2 [Lucilia cuprina]KAI8129964.1 Neuropeptide CCHamide-2 [Lucilia cuprina]
MKLSVSFFLVVICTMCLAAQQSQAKKGCNAYGYACYGGHGKRSLHTQPGETTGMELNDLQERPDTVVQFYPSEANVLIDGNLEAIPRYKLIKMMKSWFGNPHRRPVAERIPEIDYPFSAEFLNRESNSATNNNSYK